MKRFIFTALLGVGFGFGAWGAPDQIWLNYGTLTNVPMVDATSFLNSGTISVDTVNVNSNFVYPVGNSAGYTSIPFSTRDTSYYTNTPGGIMEGTVGFTFETITSTTIHSASSFVNDGYVAGFDYPANADSYSTTTGTTGIPAGSLPVASQVDVLSSNILNDGTMAVGNYGLLQLMGSNVNTANGDLIAGALNTGGGNGVDFDPLDTTGGGDNVDVFGGGGFYVNPPGVYDLYWGVTPSSANPLALDQFFPPQTTGVKVGYRQSDGGTIGFGLPINPNPMWLSAVRRNTIDQSNTYFNIVFVNTNFFDVNGQQNTNITAEIRFSDVVYSLNNSVFDTEPIVQFAATVPDVITGVTVTNAVYLVDIGGVLNQAPFSDSVNAASADGFARPQAFDVTTTTPGDWTFGQSGNIAYDPTLIYGTGLYTTKDVSYQVASYGVQIGRNPAQVDGGFNFFNFLPTFSAGRFNGVSLIGGDVVFLPDPTNEPARIELTANQLNLSNARLRSEGMVIINASNIVGQTAGSDWGQINAQIGAANGALVISNVFPTNFQRLRGDIYAWTASWVNTFTNGTTNTYHYNVLVVDQNLGDNFRSVIRNLNLTGSNSINVQDPLYVINQSYFNTSNLTFNSNTVFTQNAGSLTTANLPKLKYFLNNSNANLTVDNILDMGFDLTKTPTVPAGRKYTVVSVTNLGTMTATTPVFQSQFFENDGAITADNNGSMIIEAASLGLGLVLSNTINSLQADANITLSGLSIGAINSQIITGGVASTNRGQLLLQTAANGQITDFASSAPSTNTPLVNFWQVTDGFSLPIKPATGDLFGTEITTIAAGTTVALHTWAGVDLGASSAGFADNMVIGHLKLSRQSANAVLHFTGAGAKNGMYVDYLDLDTNSLSYTNYRSGLVIDSNLTIYFAACNSDPVKLETVYSNRLVWVPGFAGPNSTVAVPYLGSSNVCLMNINLAFSHEISFFGSVPNADNQPYVLNDPSNPTNVYPCPSDSTTFKDFVTGINASNVVNVDISTVGEGSITPNLKQSQIAMGKKYALTATPAKGWIFAGWTASGLPEGVNTTARELKFTIENNLMLTANFIPKTYTLVKGTYYGLFTNNAPAADNSGWFTFTLGENGALSGRLLMGPAKYMFNSVLPSNGLAQVTAKSGRQTLTVNLSFGDLTDPDGQVAGSVTDGIWSSLLRGYMAPTTWTTKDPSPFAGRYTMILTNGATDVTNGDSYGSLIVSKPGILSIAGKLADGEAFSQSVPISTNGLWPFYTYVGRGEDFLLGWVAFQGSEIFGYTISETNLFWSKGIASKDGFYPAGFASIFNLAASPYAFPGNESSGLTLVDPAVIFSGGGLIEPSNFPVTYNGKLTYSTNGLTLSINPTTGVFTGRLQNAEDGPSIKLSGVVLQNQDSAFGFFPGTNNESGAVLLQSQ